MARSSVALPQVSSVGSVWGRRVSALFVACGVLVGVAGCGEPVAKNAAGTSNENNSNAAASSSTQQRDPDRIYANHTEGVDPDKWRNWDFDSPEEMREQKAVFSKWGLKQTPDWLEFCNRVNVPELRKVGFDPQKNLSNRGEGVNAAGDCYWIVGREELHFMFGPVDSVEKTKSHPKFRYSHTVNRDGETYHIGKIEFVGEGTIAQAFSCSLTFERDGQGYLAAFLGKEPKTDEQSCEDLINMVSPRK